jgi:putative FmdB family regulatory protein
MPIYEYRCTACQHKLEALQKFSDAPLVTCPKCAQDALTKLVSAAGFHLKGSGWYQTDFRGGAKASEKKDKTETDGAKPAEPATAAKTESTPAKSESPASTPSDSAAA